MQWASLKTGILFLIEQQRLNDEKSVKHSSMEFFFFDQNSIEMQDSASGFCMHIKPTDISSIYNNTN